MSILGMSKRIPRSPALRLVAIAVALGVTIAGVASQLHNHGRFTGAGTKLVTRAGHDSTTETRDCLACKLSHNTVLPPTDTGTGCDPLPEAGSTGLAVATVLLAAPTGPASPRAPPATLHS